MKVDVQSPEEYLGEIIGDINSRRGQVSEQEYIYLVLYMVTVLKHVK